MRSRRDLPPPPSRSQFPLRINNIGEHFSLVGLVLLWKKKFDWVFHYIFEWFFCFCLITISFLPVISNFQFKVYFSLWIRNFSFISELPSIVMTKFLFSHYFLPSYFASPSFDVGWRLSSSIPSMRQDKLTKLELSSSGLRRINSNHTFQIHPW